ncbi:hypothetical protein CGZ80_16100 [Rhodopirellula sp. MGV]|nr:hypothetical protein CGZ80_16100 [Rhodopirellula sp. MGV]
MLGQGGINIGIGTSDCYNPARITEETKTMRHRMPIHPAKPTSTSTDAQRSRASQRAMEREQLYQRRLAAATAAKHKRGDLDDSFQVIVTSSNRRTLTKLSGQRKRRFATYFEQAIGEAELPCQIESAEHHDEMAAVDDRFSLPLYAEVCANCRGGCCLRGGDRAYLSGATIERVRRQHPTLSDQDLSDRYLKCLPEFSYEDSCVFHSEHGCGLPFDLRSDTCNNTVCGGLIEIDQRRQLDKQRNFFVAACDQENVVRSITIQEE